MWKKVWGRVINPLWGLKAPGPATKKWIFEFCTKFGFRNHLQTFWPRRLVKNELSLGLIVQMSTFHLYKIYGKYYNLSSSLINIQNKICSSNQDEQNVFRFL